LKTTARLLLLLRVLTRTSRSETRRAKGFVDDVRANIAFLRFSCGFSFVSSERKEVRAKRIF
jgi:hypothetical protein